MNTAPLFRGATEAVTDAIAQADAHLNNVGLPSYMELVQALRASNAALGLVDDFGSATGGLGNPDDQNSALDAGAALLARIGLIERPPPDARPNSFQLRMRVKPKGCAPKLTPFQSP